MLLAYEDMSPGENMSFNIESKSGPSIVTPPNTMASAIERAKAAFMQPATPVPNPTSVSPEEMTAIRPPSYESVETERQLDSNETPIETPAEAPAKAEETISSQYAVLARKEKALRLRDQQLRQREAAIKASEEAKKAPSAPAFDESKYVSKDKLTQDPFSALAELGLNYEQLTNMLLNAPSPEARAQQDYTKKLEARLEALENGQTKVEKTFQEREAESRKQAVSQIKTEVKKLVMTDPAFETIKETNSYNDVVELIEQTFDKDGVLLTVEEATQQVEDYLVEEAMKIAKIKKIQQRLMPKESPSQAPVARPQQQQQLKTLTNSVSSTRQLTSKERAILAFKGELNKK